MKINEKCDSWELKFNMASAPEVLSDEEEVTFKGILHTAGDCVAIVANIPEEEAELRQKLLNVIAFVIIEARSQIELAVEHVIMRQAFKGPLKPGFTYDEVFGLDLGIALENLLQSDEEKTIAKEYLQPPHGEDGTGAEDGDQI